MNTTKKSYGKADGLSYHHIIQSFRPGEVSPEKAHRIGVELAEKQFKDYETAKNYYKEKELKNSSKKQLNRPFQLNKNTDTKELARC